jgi:pantothenate kinase type III
MFNKNELGLDILSFAYYIQKSYIKGVGISFGTATFAVAVNQKCIYGVAIAPAFVDSINSLFTQTALIKQTTINYINFDLGHNTNTALSSGATHSVNGFVNSIMCFCKQHYKINDVYVTGGKSN